MPGAEQRLADIDVAQPGDDLLVQQRRLDRRALAGQRGGQAGRGERRVQRLRPQVRQQPVRVLLRASAPDRPSRTGADRRSRPPAVVGLQHQMLVRRVGWLRPQRGPSTMRPDMPRCSSTRIAAGQPHQDVFAAPAEAGDARAGQPLRSPSGSGQRRSGRCAVGAHDHAALQPLLQAAHHGLDLGEFRHGVRHAIDGRA